MPPCGAIKVQPNAMESAPARPEPMMQAGRTWIGSAAANGIAPSVMKASPMMKLVGPDSLSSFVNLSLNSRVASAIAHGGITQDNEIVFISYDPEKKFTVDKTTELMRIRTIAKDDTEALVNSKDYRMIGESDESIICIKETTGYLTGKLALTESELQNSLIVL